jgi:hypothetical protein
MGAEEGLATETGSLDEDAVGPPDEGPLEGKVVELEQWDHIVFGAYLRREVGQES